MGLRLQSWCQNHRVGIGASVHSKSGCVLNFKKTEKRCLPFIKKWILQRSSSLLYDLDGLEVCTALSISKSWWIRQNQLKMITAKEIRKENCSLWLLLAVHPHKSSWNATVDCHLEKTTQPIELLRQFMQFKVDKIVLFFYKVNFLFRLTLYANE